MNKALLTVLLVATFGGVLFIGSVVQNKGCMPWQTAVTTGSGVFSENDRSRTYCR